MNACQEAFARNRAEGMSQRRADLEKADKDCSTLARLLAQQSVQMQR